MDNTTLTFNNGTTMTTAATGTVSSVATGNGLQGGTITTSGTLSVACPTFNTVGSYVWGATNPNRTAGTSNVTSGSNYSAGGGGNQIGTGALNHDDGGGLGLPYANNLSGTWKWMGASGSIGAGGSVNGVCCRVS